jgi:hypothetical protein
MAPAKPRHKRKTPAQLKAENAAEQEAVEARHQREQAKAAKAERIVRGCRQRLRKALLRGYADVVYPFEDFPGEADLKTVREAQLAKDLGVGVRSVRAYLDDGSNETSTKNTMPSERLLRAVERVTGFRRDYIVRGEKPERTTEVKTEDWSADLCAWLRAELGEVDPARSVIRRADLSLDPERLKAFIVDAVRAAEDADNELQETIVTESKLMSCVASMGKLLQSAGNHQTANLAKETMDEAVRELRVRVTPRLFLLFAHASLKVGALPRFTLQTRVGTP